MSRGNWSAIVAAAVVAAAFIAGTIGLGWWAVPAVGFVAGVAPLVRAPRVPAWLVGLAASVAWAALLAFRATAPAFAGVVARVAGVMSLPPAALVAVTLLFAFGLAWSAAAIVQSLARDRR